MSHKGGVMHAIQPIIVGINAGKSIELLKDRAQRAILQTLIDPRHRMLGGNMRPLYIDAWPNNFHLCALILCPPGVSAREPDAKDISSEGIPDELWPNKPFHFEMEKLFELAKVDTEQFGWDTAIARFRQFATSADQIDRKEALEERLARMEVTPEERDNFRKDLLSDLSHPNWARVIDMSIASPVAPLLHIGLESCVLHCYLSLKHAPVGLSVDVPRASIARANESVVIAAVAESGIHQLISDLQQNALDRWCPITEDTVIGALRWGTGYEPRRRAGEIVDFETWERLFKLGAEICPVLTEVSPDRLYDEWSQIANSHSSEGERRFVIASANQGQGDTTQTVIIAENLQIKAFLRYCLTEVMFCQP